MTNRKSRRIQQISGYIGAGNRTSVFNRSPRTSFERIKKIYEIELYSTDSESPHEKQRKKLTQQERATIKNRVRKELEAQEMKMILRYVIIAIVIIGILILTNYLDSRNI